MYTRTIKHPASWTIKEPDKRSRHYTSLLSVYLGPTLLTFYFLSIADLQLLPVGAIACHDILVSLLRLSDFMRLTRVL